MQPWRYERLLMSYKVKPACVGAKQLSESTVSALTIAKRHGWIFAGVLSRQEANICWVATHFPALKAKKFFTTRT
jgi:hypothetical protein